MLKLLLFYLNNLVNRKRGIYVPLFEKYVKKNHFGSAIV